MIVKQLGEMTVRQILGICQINHCAETNCPFYNGTECVIENLLKYKDMYLVKEDGQYRLLNVNEYINRLEN